MEIEFRARINEKGRAEHLAEWQHFTLDDLLDGHASELNERIDRKTICLSTTLRDKHGKEIWEGDIVTAHYFYFDGNFDADGHITGEIRITTNGILIWKSDSEARFIYETTHDEEPCLEVIGSIYGEGE